MVLMDQPPSTRTSVTVFSFRVAMTRFGRAATRTTIRVSCRFTGFTAQVTEDMLCIYILYTYTLVYIIWYMYIYIWFRACYRRSFLQCFHTRLRSLCFCSAHPCRNDDHRGEKKVTCACHSNSLYLPATVPGLFPGEKKANMGTPRKN